MRKFHKFQELFSIFNWILLFHGLTGLIYSTWNRRFLFLVGFSAFIVFWGFSGYHYVQYFKSYVLVTFYYDLFESFINLTDEGTWVLSTFSMHCLSLKLNFKLFDTLNSLEQISDRNISHRVKVTINSILIFTMAYCYIGIPYLRLTFTILSQSMWALLPVYCYQLCVLMFQQIFYFIVVYQVKLNLEQIRISSAEVHLNISIYDANIKVYRKTSKFFTVSFVFNLFSCLIGISNLSFVGFVQGNTESAILEYLIWDVAFLATLTVVVLSHNIADEVTKLFYFRY